MEEGLAISANPGFVSMTTGSQIPKTRVNWVFKNPESSPVISFELDVTILNCGYSHGISQLGLYNRT